MSSDVAAAFDAPWIEPVHGYGDVKFARADMDYWSWRSEQEKQSRVAADLAKLRKVPIIDPMKVAAEETKIERQRVFLGEVIDSQYTAEGLKQLILDSIERGGRPRSEAEEIRKRIPPGRQVQLGGIICSEPVATIEQYRDAVRELCKKRGMEAQQVARLTDEDLIRIARETPPQQTALKEGEDPLAAGPASPTDMPK